MPALNKDGRQISIELSIQLLKDRKRQVDWVVAFIRDVSERYNRESVAAALSPLCQPKPLGPSLSAA